MKPEKNPKFIYLISNRQAFRQSAEASEGVTVRRQIEAIGLAASAGCDLIQIREKDLPAREMLALTRMAIEVARPHGARVLVNDRLDVALAANADGVHLTATSLSAAEARAITDGLGRPEFMIGVSTHSLEEAEAAQSQGADFIVSGPVFDTLSKRAFGEPMGIARFSEICSRIRIPVLALGGITPQNFRQPLEAGAAGIAGIGLFTDPATIERNIRTLQTDIAVQRRNQVSLPGRKID